MSIELKITVEESSLDSFRRLIREEVDAAVTVEATPVATPPALPPVYLVNPKHSYYQPIDKLQVHPASAQILQRMGPGHLQLGYHAQLIDTDYNDRAKMMVVDVHYADDNEVPSFAEESDGLGPVYIPPGMQDDIAGEGLVSIVDHTAGKLHEFRDVRYNEMRGMLFCTRYARWDLICGPRCHRTLGNISADDSGLPVAPGLVRFEEIAAGRINHAIRLSHDVTRRAIMYPAARWASGIVDEFAPPMGTRLRLHSDFDLTNFTERTQVILRAMKEFGVILSDNSAIPWMLHAAQDERWESDRRAYQMSALELRELVPLTALEVVATSETFTDYGAADEAYKAIESNKKEG